MSATHIFSLSIHQSADTESPRFARNLRCQTRQNGGKFPLPSCPCLQWASRNGQKGPSRIHLERPQYTLRANNRRHNKLTQHARPCHSGDTRHFDGTQNQLLAQRESQHSQVNTLIALNQILVEEQRMNNELLAAILGKLTDQQEGFHSSSFQVTQDGENPAMLEFVIMDLLPTTRESLRLGRRSWLRGD
jgi:hypothetical protein